MGLTDPCRACTHENTSRFSAVGVDLYASEPHNSDDMPVIDGCMAAGQLSDDM